MTRSTTDLGDELLERWLDPALFFCLELADAIVYKTTTAFEFYFSIYECWHVNQSLNRKVKLKSTEAVVVL